MCIFFLVSTYSLSCHPDQPINQAVANSPPKKYYACWDYRTIASAWCKDYCNTGIPCTGDKRMYYPTEVE